MTTDASATVEASRIDGVKTKSLRLIPDERGWLMEILRADERTVHEVRTGLRLGDLSRCRQGLALPRRQVDNFACVAGMVKLVLVDTATRSPTNGAINEFFSARRIRRSCRCRTSSTTAGSASARACRS
jgi:dTDP-4-dehydrorhamnose 3,5-epimerase